jgi:16S rRNA (cytidine1402-2'-O)-methyltransferase
MSGTLYLIPTTLGGDHWEEIIPTHVAEVTRSLRSFFVEDARTARRYLSCLGMPVSIQELSFDILNEHSTQSDVENLLGHLLSGKSVGLLSEAGVPAVADPGSLLISMAHNKGVKVVPLTGPSSIILALMASGLNGQNFAFVGYLPVKPNERDKRIRQLELRSKEEKQTQLFIEAPYRNNQLLKSLVSVLHPETNLHISCDLTLPTEFVLTQRVKVWKKQMPDLHKRPSIFGILRD